MSASTSEEDAGPVCVSEFDGKTTASTAVYVVLGPQSLYLSRMKKSARTLGVLDVDE